MGDCAVVSNYAIKQEMVLLSIMQISGAVKQSSFSRFSINNEGFAVIRNYGSLTLSMVIRDFFG